MNDEREAEAVLAAERLQHLAAKPVLSDQEASDLKAVLHALRCYKFERDGERAAVKRILENWKRAEAGNKAKLNRVAQLLSRKRKTLAMADLYAALDDNGRPSGDDHG